MKRTDLLKYISNFELLDEYSFLELRALLKKYPYFHTAYQLLLLNLKNISDPRFKEFTRNYAIYIKENAKCTRLINELELRESSKESKSSETVDENTKPAHVINEPVEQSDQVIKEEIPESSKKQKENKDKNIRANYLKKRISDTLSVQTNQGNDQADLQDNTGGDFFILDKASQVERKISQRFQKNSDSQGQTQQPQHEKKNYQEEADSFELENPDKQSGKKEVASRRVHHIGGQYFTEKDYVQNARDKDSENDLIGKFITKLPEMDSLQPPHEDQSQEDVSANSTAETDELLSEKLVEIYIRQGYYEKAISACEKLSLKYPEKSHYFAQKIQEIRNIIQEQQKE